MDHFKREVGGFDFELTRRNDVALGKMKLQLPKYRKTGTTLAGGTSHSRNFEKSTFFDFLKESLSLSHSSVKMLSFSKKCVCVCLSVF